MFEKFSKNKANYRKGQLFPFLIAIICVIIILMLITVNLGKSAIYQTDVSNAADAGALAGVSVLSGVLLSLGLRSDMMCGQAIITLIAIIIACCCYAWINAIMYYILHLSSMIQAYGYAWSESRMGWSNAKKTAMNYALQNIGVDEPKPPYSACGGSYEDYLKDTNDCSKTGYSLYMETASYYKDGLWGDIEPLETFPYTITTGYGWDDAPENAGSNNCFSDGSCACTANGCTANSYKGYQNWVEAKVRGIPLYPLEFWSFLVYAVSLPACLKSWFRDEFNIPDWLQVFEDPTAWVIENFMPYLNNAVSYIYPTGLTLIDNNTDLWTTEQPFMVDAWRHRSGRSTGLWDFQYGTFDSSAVAHVFREDLCRSVRPAFFMPEDSCPDIVVSEDEGCAWFQELLDASETSDWSFDWFTTEYHLFETELISTE